MPVCLCVFKFLGFKFLCQCRCLCVCARSGGLRVSEAATLSGQGTRQQRGSHWHWQPGRCSLAGPQASGIFRRGVPVPVGLRDRDIANWLSRQGHMGPPGRLEPGPRRMPVQVPVPGSSVRRPALARSKVNTLHVDRPGRVPVSSLASPRREGGADTSALPAIVLRFCIGARKKKKVRVKL